MGPGSRNASPHCCPPQITYCHKRYNESKAHIAAQTHTCLPSEMTEVEHSIDMPSVLTYELSIPKKPCVVIE